jgi:hypothetical protein
MERLLQDIPYAESMKHKFLELKQKLTLKGSASAEAAKHVLGML